MGFGYRAELDSFAIDVSFLNYQLLSSSPVYGPSGYYSAGGGASGSFLKLEGLYFLKPAANASTYFGGGLSYGMTSLSKSDGSSQTSLHGSGLQGELTIGYEIPRASTMRIFVQADAVLPFYRATGDVVTYTPSLPNYQRTPSKVQYTPSLGVSIGVGWHKR